MQRLEVSGAVRHICIYIYIYIYIVRRLHKHCCSNYNSTNNFTHNQHKLVEQFYHVANISTLNSGQDQAVIKKKNMNHKETAYIIWSFPSCTIKCI
jgi:hypothetical protein